MGGKSISYRVYSSITALVGLVCIAIVGVTFDSYSANHTIINMLFVQVAILVMFIILAIPVALNPKFSIPMLIISCVCQIIVTPFFFGIDAFVVKGIHDHQSNNARMILEQFKGLNGGQGYFNYSNSDCTIRYSFDIDSNTKANITITENIDGIVDNILYSISSENFYSEYDSIKPPINSIQTAIDDLDSRLIKNSSLYKNIALERYTPIISDEIIQLYESGETDSKHNLQNDGNIRTYERLETRFGDNFSYTFSLDSK